MTGSAEKPSATDAAPANRVEDHLRQRSTRDQAFVLVIVAILLLMPPFANVLHIDGRVFGVPVTLVYLFAVWAGLIVATRRLARRLGDDEAIRREPGP